jgi:hypothetical protein
MNTKKYIRSSVLADAPTQIVPRLGEDQQTTENPTVQLLTRGELSRRWNLSIETLKRWEKSGKLPFIKLGKEVRYRITVVEQIENISEVTK